MAPVINRWTLEQFGGNPAQGGNPAVGSTGIIITFRSKLYSLNKAEVAVSGAAVLDSTRGFSWSGNKCTVPVIVSETGVATVTIKKPGVTAGSKNVTVYKSDDITWATEQVYIGPAGGDNPEESFTGILIKFSSALPSDLDVTEVTVSGAATPDATRAFSWSGNDCTVPVIVTEAGVATVTVNKPGVAAGSQDVMVYDTTLNPLFAEVFDIIHVAKPLFGRAYAHGSSAPVNSRIKGAVINHRFDFDDDIKNDVFIDNSRLLTTYSPEATPDIIATWDNYDDIEGMTRPGAIRSQTKYIIYHDTANTNMGALGHAIYQQNNLIDPTTWVSWHYTVDSGNIFYSIPDNELAWHSGNCEGNLYSVGIETCVNWASDLFQTWQRMAKLCASLLEKYELPITAVLSHKEISAIGYSNGWATYIKCCPKTIRHATLYDSTAKKMIEYELLYLQKIEKAGYKAEFQIDPDSAEYIDKDGRVIKLPSVPRMVSYTIKLTDPDNTTQEKRYHSLLPSTEADYIDRCDLNGCVTNNITSFTSFFSTGLFRGIFQSPEDQSCIYSDQRGNR